MKPKRSTLSVPGHIEKMHAKAAQSRADVVMLDLEDSVPLDAKEAARDVVIQSIRLLNWQEKTVTFRINGLDTLFGYRDLLEVVEATGPQLDAVVVPKVNHPKDIYFVCRMLDGIEMKKDFSRRIGIEAIIESAQGLENVSEIARASDRLKTLVFGIVDYSASIGARLVSISGHGEKEEEVYPGHRWNFEMSRIVMAAKANGLLAIDAPYGNFRDPEGLERAAAMACALGFDGKWAIHPDQVDGINQVFSPSREDIARAEKVLAAHRDAEEKGLGAVAVEGRMVDRATVRLAKQLYEQAKYLKLI
uniref:CoA ester lyase n=1 Tax=Candidatus Desulfatibia profunda TaxID=2841695 RepID=A0A8J6NNU5_9BACT|nr:CoA ester lyase [Candidatus Desulfatibia profunda]